MVAAGGTVARGGLRPARERFAAWVETGGCASAGPGPAEGVELVRVLWNDTTTLSARTRFHLPGCHAPTHAHAARLLALLVGQGFVPDWSDLPAGVAAVPPSVLGACNRLVDDGLRTEAPERPATPPATASVPTTGPGRHAT